MTDRSPAEGRPRTVADAVGHACTSCGKTVSECDEIIQRRGKGCCATCFRTDTHGLLQRDDSRTVADALDYALDAGQGSSTHHLIARYLVGIDPDMPYDQFRRRLAMGERAEQAAHWLSYSLKPGSADRCDGANAMLDYIRGDQ